MRTFILSLIITLSALSAQARTTHPLPVSASDADTLTPAEARQALDVLSDERKRNEVIATLRTVAKAGVVVNASAVASAPAAADASAVAAAAASAPARASPFTANSLIAAMLESSETWLKAATREARNTAHAALQVSALSGWFSSLVQTPNGRAQLFDGLWRLLVVLAAGLAAQWVVRWALRKPRLSLRSWVDHKVAAAEASGRFLAGDTLITFLAGEADLAAARAAAAAGKATPVTADAATATSPPVAPDSAAAADSSLTMPAAPTSIIPPSGTSSSTPLREAPRPTHWAFLRRLPGAFALALLALIPVLAFFGVTAALNTVLVEPDAAVRPLLLQLCNAWISFMGVMVAVRLLIAPHAPGLRLLPLDDVMALFAEIWFRRIALLFIFGGALADAAADSGLSADAHRALLRLFSLLAHVAMIVMVVRSRHVVASWIRPADGKDNALGALRNWLADVWVVFAVCLIAGVWFVWALGVDDGFQKLLHILGNTALILVAARVASIVALGTLGRLLQQNGNGSGSLVEQRAMHYYPMLQRVVSTVIGLCTAMALLQAWGFNVLGWLRHGTLGPRLFSAAVNIGVMSILALLIWEVINISADRRIQMWTERGDHMRSVRLRTLLPVLRTTVLIIMLLIIGLTGLNQLGINTAPLLAGASIIGVALGFGSQKLVQDFITGIFLMLEDAMEVGDWVTAAGVSGSVEKLSIRTVRLRGGDGSLYIIPFSSVTTVNNVNRGLGNAAVKVSVAYPQDPDKVGAALTEIAAGMQQDPAFKDSILGDFQLWGVDSVDGATITLAGQIPTTDRGRWGVQREFNRRMFKRFQELGIEIANPNRTLMVPGANAINPQSAPPAAPPTNQPVGPTAL